MIVVYSEFGGFPASPFDSIYYYTVEFVTHLICLDVVIPSRGQGGGSQPESAGGTKMTTPNSQGPDREIREFSNGSYMLIVLSILILVTLVLHSIHSPLGHLARKYKQNTCIRHVIVTVQCMVRYFTSSQYHFTAFDITILEMKELSLSLEH